MPDYPDNGNVNANEALPYENAGTESAETQPAETQPADGGTAVDGRVAETSEGKTFMKIPENDDDNHLGKGLIKPTSVQVSIDGYHFSYEKPTPRLAKAESFIKESVVEKRVVDPVFDLSVRDNIQPTDGKAETADGVNMETGCADVLMPEESRGEEHVLEQPDGMEDPVPAETTADDGAIFEGTSGTEGGESLWAADEPANLEDGLPTDVLAEEPAEAANEQDESEAAPGPVQASEGASDLGTDSSPETANTEEINYLAGRQTWFGVPLPSVYRITNLGIVLVDSANRVRRIPWGSVAEVRLKQSIIGKILGVGNIELRLEEAGASPVVIEGVLRPKEVLKKIEALMDGEV